MNGVTDNLRGSNMSTRTRIIYNMSKCKTEKAKRSTCPHCKGAGGCITDKECHCPYCDGYGWLWLSDSSCIMKPYGRFEQDEQIY